LDNFNIPFVDLNIKKSNKNYTNKEIKNFKFNLKSNKFILNNEQNPPIFDLKNNDINEKDKQLINQDEKEKKNNIQKNQNLQKNLIQISKNIPKIKKDYKIYDKEVLAVKFKNNLKLRKTSFKEDPNYLPSSNINNNQLELKLPLEYSCFNEYENLNSSRMNVYNFYDHTEECYKIISFLEKKKLIEENKDKGKNNILIDENIIKKIKQFNSKLILFDLNETLIHYSFDNVNEFDHIIKIDIINSEIKSNNIIDDKNKDKQKTVILLGINLRPNLFETLKDLSKNFILGIFTSTKKELADKLIDFLDPKNEIFKIKLYRENCLKILNPYISNNKLINFKDNILKNKDNKENEDQEFTNLNTNIDKNHTNNLRINKINQYIINKNNKISDNLLYSNEKQNKESENNYNVNNDFLLKEYFYIKDLSILFNNSNNNIPLEKIVIIDNSILSFYLQINNGIPIFPFYEDKNDNELRVLVNYLNHLKKFDDVRLENKAILKLHLINKDYESQFEFTSESSVDFENLECFTNEFLYDSELNENIFYNNFKDKEKNVTKNNNNPDKEKIQIQALNINKLLIDNDNNNFSKNSNSNLNENINDFYSSEKNNKNIKQENNNIDEILSSPSFSEKKIINNLNQNNYNEYIYNLNNGSNNNNHNQNICVNNFNNNEIFENTYHSFKTYNEFNYENKLILNQKIINIEKENKDFSLYSSMSININNNLNFSFGCNSGKKDYFSNKSIFSKSGISNKSYVKEKLYICLEDLHNKFTDYCKKGKSTIEYE
jgi:TFIIF-interacting CTD phosphatase-like protein